MSEVNKPTSNPTIEALFAAGAHMGYSKSRRHPSVSDLIYGAKNRTEIIDLEKTVQFLDKAKAFARELGRHKKVIMFASSKNEAKDSIRLAAETLGMPYVAGRWIGGTLTNFSEIKKRLGRLAELKEKKESGELQKYTKKERLLFDREVKKLEETFGGITTLSGLPSALFLVDPKKEDLAVKEARSKKVPVIAILNTDCDMTLVDYPVPGNDALKGSIEFFVKEIVIAYEGGLKDAPVEAPGESKAEGAQV